MALTGLEIYKLLPKTNCGDCGVPTCLAFAMKLTQKSVELAECPHASDEAKSVLGAASEPPMRTLKIGVGPDAFEVGGETEMFRHGKTFYHQTAIAIRIDDNQNRETISAQVQEADAYVIERVGERLHIDAFCLSNSSGDKEKYLEALRAVTANSSKAVILDCGVPETVKAALEMLNGKKPVIFPGDVDPSQFVEMAEEGGASLIVSGSSFDEIAEQVDTIVQLGYKNLLLNMTSSNSGTRVQDHTILRRSALRKGFKPFGYPLVWFMDTDDDYPLFADAVIGACKYSGMIVLPKFNKEMILTLLTLRQNIYTDPQKPIQVDPKAYAVGEPGPDSPVFLTTNFSLTYFIISGEIENAGISAWLVIPDCEGMSVLTAWAAGKFSGKKIGKFVQEIGLEDRVDTREIIIPGFVASISGELEDALPNWKVTVGPQEAVDIASFVKHHFQ